MGKGKGGEGDHRPKPLHFLQQTVNFFTRRRAALFLSHFSYCFTPHSFRKVSGGAFPDAMPRRPFFLREHIHTRVSPLVRRRFMCCLTQRDTK